MGKICKLMGTFFLSVAALIVVMGPASFSGYAIEEVPQSVQKKR